MRAPGILLVTLFAIVRNHSSESLRILGLNSLPVKSHFILLESLMKSLASKGHRVDFISHFPQKVPYPNLRDISIAGAIPTYVNNVSFAESQTFGRASFRKFLNRVGSGPCNQLSTPQLQDLLKKPKKTYDVVVVEMFTSYCFLALGRHFDVPVVGVIPSKMQDWVYGPTGNSLNSAYVGSLYASYTQDMNFYERLKNTLIVNDNVLRFNLYFEDQLAYVEKYFGRKLTSMKELFDDLSILLVNSHYSINEIRPLTPNVVEIAGLHVNRESPRELSAEVEEWLDESKDGCVFISFGSMTRLETLPADKLEAFYEMFRRISPVRVLVKIADPKVLPPNLPSNVKTSPWLPQVEILRHNNTRAFVTHGGLLGTLESVAWGVPMVGIPLFSDQFKNIQLYAKKKIATTLNVHTMTADDLTIAVETVLNNPQYSKNAKDIAALFRDRLQSPEDTAVYWVEYAARHGNHLQSPATKLTWWQFHLLDVYGFILFTIILTLYTLKRIIKMIYRIVFSSKNPRANKSKKLQ